MSPLFPKKIGRFPYASRLSCCLLLSFSFGFLLSFLGRNAPFFLKSPLFLPLLWGLTIIWYSYLLMCVVAPRLRDIGLSPYLALAGFIPGINVALGLCALFAPSGWWQNRLQTKQAASSCPSDH